VGANQPGGAHTKGRTSQEVNQPESKKTRRRKNHEANQPEEGKMAKGQKSQNSILESYYYVTFCHINKYTISSILLQLH